MGPAPSRAEAEERAGAGASPSASTTTIAPPPPSTGDFFAPVAGSARPSPPSSLRGTPRATTAEEGEPEFAFSPFRRAAAVDIEKPSPSIWPVSDNPPADATPPKVVVRRGANGSSAKASIDADDVVDAPVSLTTTTTTTRQQPPALPPPTPDPKQQSPATIPPPPPRSNASAASLASSASTSALRPETPRGGRDDGDESDDGRTAAAVASSSSLSSSAPPTASSSSSSLLPPPPALRVSVPRARKPSDLSENSQLSSPREEDEEEEEEREERKGQEAGASPSAPAPLEERSSSLPQQQRRQSLELHLPPLPQPVVPFSAAAPAPAAAPAVRPQSASAAVSTTASAESSRHGPPLTPRAATAAAAVRPLLERLRAIQDGEQRQPQDGEQRQPATAAASAAGPAVSPRTAAADAAFAASVTAGALAAAGSSLSALSALDAVGRDEELSVAGDDEGDDEDDDADAPFGRPLPPGAARPESGRRSQRWQQRTGSPSAATTRSSFDLLSGATAPGLSPRSPRFGQPRSPRPPPASTPPSRSPRDGNVPPPPPPPPSRPASSFARPHSAAAALAASLRGGSAAAGAAAPVQPPASWGTVSGPVRETRGLSLVRCPGGATLLNQYAVIKHLGKGACGRVYLVMDSSDCSLYAAKVVKRPRTAPPLTNASSRQQQPPSSLGGAGSCPSPLPAGPSSSPRGGGADGATARSLSRFGRAASAGPVPFASSATPPPAASSPSAAAAAETVAPPPSSATDSSVATASADDLRREVSVMRRLRHRNLVSLREVIDDPLGGRLAMVMEYAEGGALLPRADLDRGRRLAEPVARRAFRDVVAGLSYLHANRIVHGDIKPENVLCGAGGSVKLSDFGCAKVMRRKSGGAGGGGARSPPASSSSPRFAAPNPSSSPFDAEDSNSNPVYADDPTLDDVFDRCDGTPAFLAPEVALGVPGGADAPPSEGAAEGGAQQQQGAAARVRPGPSRVRYRGRPADVWSLGACLYTLAFGRIPYTAPSVPALFRVVRSEPLRFPADVSVSPLLKDLLCRMMCKDVDARITLRGAAAHPWTRGLVGGRGGASPALGECVPRSPRDLSAPPASLSSLSGGNRSAGTSTNPPRIDRLALELVTPESRVVEFEDGETMLRAGEPGTHALFLLQGSAEVWQRPGLGLQLAHQRAKLRMRQRDMERGGSGGGSFDAADDASLLSLVAGVGDDANASSFSFALPSLPPLDAATVAALPPAAVAGARRARAIAAALARGNGGGGGGASTAPGPRRRTTSDGDGREGYYAVALRPPGHFVGEAAALAAAGRRGATAVARGRVRAAVVPAASLRALVDSCPHARQQAKELVWSKTAETLVLEAVIRLAALAEALDRCPKLDRHLKQRTKF